MKIPVKTRIALWWTRVRHRHPNANGQLLLSNQGSGVSSVLIILPDSLAGARIAQYFLKSLSTEKQSKKSLSFLCREGLKEFFSTNVQEITMTYSDEDINRWGLPSHELQERLALTEYEAIVDLNTELNPVSSSIVRMSSAPVRLGFHWEHSHRFFNIIMGYDGTGLLEKDYLLIQQLLGL